MIRYEGKTYPAGWVEVEGFGERYISVESLEKALMLNEEYKDDNARWLDERIFFYIPDEVWDKVNLGEYVALEVM